MQLPRALSARTYRALGSMYHTTVAAKSDILQGTNFSFQKPNPTTGHKVFSPTIEARAQPTLVRPLGALESFFKTLEDSRTSINPEHGACITVTQVRFPFHLKDVEAYIARAWVEVGRQFPALRAEVSYSPNEANPSNCSVVTLKPFSEPVFRDKFFVHPGCSNIDVLFSTHYRGRGTTTCHWLPDPGQIILRSSHWRVDGLGIVMLSDAFMSTLANIMQRGLHSPLDSDPMLQTHPSPNLEYLIREHVQDQPCEASVADDLVNTLADGGQSITLPTQPGSIMAGPTASVRAAIRMSSVSSAVLSRACRAQGISVTSAINAAIIRATAQFPQDPKAESYAMFAPVDLRRLLIAAGAKDCLQPTGTYLSWLPLRIEGVMKRLENGSNIPGKSFGTLTHELNTFYSQDVLRYRKCGGASGETVNLLQLAEPYMERITRFFSSFSLPGCPYPKTPAMSSLGRLDTFIKSEYPGDCDNVSDTSKLHVTDFWVCNEQAMPMLMFNPWSWGGQITISAAWNNGYYSTKLVCDVLKNIVKELSDGLKIGHISYRVVNSCCEVPEKRSG